MILPRKKEFILDRDFVTGYDVEIDNEGRDPLRPEKALCAAILERAISDALDATGRIDYGGTTLQRKAYSWIVFSKIREDRPSPFSYSWICHVLDYDPYEIRRIVIKARRSKRKYLRDGRGRVRVGSPLAKF